MPSVVTRDPQVAPADFDGTNKTVGMSKNAQPLLLKRSSTPMRLVAAGLLALLASGCNDYPVHSLLDSFGARVTSNLSHNTPVKLDFLWVIDHSTSMCKQQRILAQGFDTFIANLQALGQVDAQMAVVTVQQMADYPSATGVTVKTVGKFNNIAAQNFPPNCIEHYRAPCYIDGPVDPTAPSDQCRDGFNFQFTQGKNYQLPASSLLNVVMPPDPATDANGKPQHGGPGYGDAYKHYQPNLPVKDNAPTNEWRCQHPDALSLVTNDNGSVNSYCQRHCTTDAECQGLFNDPAAICYTPGGKNGDPTTSGCMFPPNTKDCPNPDDASGPACQTDDTCPALSHCVDHSVKLDGSLKTCTNYLPSVLHNDQLNMFHCIATVGAASSQQSGFEGGLRSAWMALDPAGPNCPGGLYTLDDNGVPQVDGAGKPVLNPNCQYAQLVRDDAYLVVVVVSDDDDCSVQLNLSLANGSPEEKAALKSLLPTEDWAICQRLGDAVGGNARLNEGNCLYVKSKQPDPTQYLCPSDCVAGAANYDTCMAAAAVNVQKNRAVDARFAPVSDFVNRFKSLKSDPAHVIFAAISGDSDAQIYQDGKPQFDANGAPVPDEAQKIVDAAIYMKSLRRNIASNQSPYVCAGAKGESGYGSRYIEMANAFRENGIFANICSGADFSAPLNGIASTILKRVVKICLPYPPDRDASNQPILQVNRTRTDATGTPTTTTLTYTADTTSHVVDQFYLQASPDCRSSATAVAGESQPCATIRDCAPGLACIKNVDTDATGQCLLYSEAIYFTEVPQQGDALEINYGANLGFTAAATTPN